MRDTLKDAVKKAITFEYQLPNMEHGINKSCLSSKNDACFSSLDSEEVSHIIYNGIVEYAINEFEIDYDNLDLEQRKAILSSIRYNENAAQPEKLKYGFYGEVLFDLILRSKLKTSLWIAKGYFYSPVESSEPNGFDSFHFFERNDNLELWFGESKFHQSYRTAITQVLEKIHTSLSDEYLSKNLIAIIKERAHISSGNPKTNSIIDAWLNNPDINLVDEVNRNSIDLVYPIFIAYEKLKRSDYQQNIQTCVQHIANEFKRLNIKIPATFNYKIFFMFLPLSEVKKIKEQVIKWIESKEPLI